MTSTAVAPRSATRRAAPASVRSDKASRVGVIAAVALVAGVPILFDPSGYDGFLAVKWVAVLALVPLGLAFGRGRPPLATWWILLLGTLLVATVAGVAPGLGIVGGPGRNLGLMAWLVFAGAFVLGTGVGEVHVRTVLRAAVVASVPVSLYALAQAAGIDPLSWDASLDVSRARSTFGNAAFLGAYLTLVVPLAAHLALDEEKRARLVSAGALVLGVGALAATGTRAAWLGAAVGLAVVAWFHRGHLPSGRVLGAVAVVGVILLAVTPLGGRALSTLDPTEGTARGRLVQWQTTTRLVAERPVLGWGPETHTIALPHAADERFEREVGRGRVPDRAHNVLLDMAQAAGIVGVAAYLALVAGVLAAGVRAARRTPLAVGLLGAVAGYLVQLQFSFVLAHLDVVFWLGAGMLVALGSSRGGAPSQRPRWLAAALVVCAVLGAGWAVREVVADHRLRGALGAEAAGDLRSADGLFRSAASVAPERIQFAEAAARFHVRLAEELGVPGPLALAEAELDRALWWAPGDPELRLVSAEIALARSPEEGLSAYEAVVDADPSFAHAWLGLGRARAESGDLVGAEGAWHRAAFLAPRSDAPLVNLGLLYERRGRPDDAVAAFTEALERDPMSTAADHLRRLEPASLPVTGIEGSG